MEVDTAPTVTDLSGELHACFALLERFVGSREPRLVANALRCVGPFRKKAKEAPAVAVGALSAALDSHVSPAAVLRTPLTELLALIAKPHPAVPTPSAPAPGEDADAEAIVMHLHAAENSSCSIATSW